MSFFKYLSKKKKDLEVWADNLPAMVVYYKVLILGNVVIGITSGIFLRFFWEAIKFTDYKYLTLFYTIRILMYFWLVFYGGTSLILALNRVKEMPKWAEISVYGYILFSLSCLYLFESFMPFQVLGGEMFSIVFRWVMYS